VIAETSVPAFGPGMRMRFDGVRDAWVVLGPERLFQPDGIAVEVLKLIDGQRSFGAIIDDLCSRFAAPREVVAGDVSDLLEELAGKGVVTL
jgi:pyrroloquinoline quinone biosynthesis protein D